MAKKRDLKILITGASGMVGNYAGFGRKTDRLSLDVAKLSETLSFVRKEKPDAIVHLAALTDLDAAEKNPAAAYLVNAAGAYHLALAARENRAKLVYVSTAGVFDGTKKGPYAENDAPNPQNVYGHSKYLGELAVRGVLDNYIIARACWMFGGGPGRDKKFVAKIISQFDKKEIFALGDAAGSPTFGKDLIAAVKKLIDADARGIFHLSNAGSATRFDVAKLIVETLKPEIKVTPVAAAYFKLPAVRVKNEALSSKVKLLRPWQEALKEYLVTEWKPAIG